ncbi:predicted protein [Phaeodactylum tricornutum CCAP 1055/1]|uniref:Ion transport domain-containing protein n=2 Tax=Phaeodactylum tricornutum TaxID=2850 RepID=B7GDG8_PHATC|nr:predicted protein [Phaeodactylum tricornutum CCAP 1055/1]EEC43260.1 predicted protein [Phaeodactylum tricornutum CCAP 1055/1]|eukprot:XP_002185128.1 predicted protein [Phaeodactylum tricornutum CCAP 1055/1]
MERTEDAGDRAESPGQPSEGPANAPTEGVDEINDFEQDNLTAHSLEESHWTGTETVVSQDDVPDALLLNLFCARAKAPKETEDSLIEAEESWQPVREWLGSHDAEQVRAAAEQRGENGLTAIHFACRNVPPLDVIDVFLSIAADTVQWPDGFGWLPIHYACASGSEEAVIKALAEHFPESKTATDGRGRTPLHFALGDKPASPDVIFLLSSSGAASFPDDIGMLPLHYACAFGASEEVLYVLTDAYPEAITSRDKRQRTPLHFALSNAGRKTVPAAVRLLLSLDRRIVNSVEGGPLPLSVLAAYAAIVRNEDENRDKRESVQRCLEHLLHAEPEPTADFFTALQSLPDWLSERAVVMPVVQILLNEKISQRFPTAVLMMDFYVLTMVIISYSHNVVNSIQRRFDDDDTNDTIATKSLIPLYLGVAYFALREVVQIMSLLSLKVFKLWLYDPSNYLNVAFIALVLSWTVVMDSGAGDRDTFRVGAAVSVTILWVKLLAYLRNMLIDFAVFVGGVFYVVRRLAAFLLALGLILVAFAQMFYTVFQQTDYCRNQPQNDLDYDLILAETRCDASTLRPYCGFWTSFLSVYTMLLGEVDEDDFESSGVAMALFVIFMFLVVILLANVLIAIVTDSYKVIQYQRAAIVFWTNRLDFVAEMDAIANGPWKSRVKKSLGMLDQDEDGAQQRDVFGKDLWKQIMDLFEDDSFDGMSTVDFIAFALLRVVACVFIIPMWLLLGIVTVGWFWPPQVREAVFTSKVSKHSSDTAKEDELRRTQVKQLQQDVIEMRDDLLQELALDRTQIVQMKSQVAERKLEIANEMKQVKRLVTMLFERQIAFSA